MKLNKSCVYSVVVILFVASACFAEFIKFDESHGVYISRENLLGSVMDIAKGLVQSFGNRLNADYFFKFIGNLVLGVPSELATVIANRICEAVLSEDAIKPDPDHMPQIDNISLQLRTPCKIKEVSLDQLSTIVYDADFDVNKAVVIASSGWLTNANKSDDVLEGLAKAYNCRNDTNFLGIDVGPYIQTLYTWSALNTQTIGRQIAVALVNFTQVMPLSNLHLMGHSLGAQIVGEAARHFSRLTRGRKIPRVTGFDPASTCFNYGQGLTTLSASDAEYVDIIHTNPGIAGQWAATADADFYVGGHFPIQNGCLDAVCSHQRSWQYYMETVYPGNERNFLAKRCDSFFNLHQGHCVGEEYPMGYALSKGVKGVFVLEVNAQEPFGKNASASYRSTEERCGQCQQ